MADSQNGTRTFLADSSSICDSYVCDLNAKIPESLPWSPEVAPVTHLAAAASDVSTDPLTSKASKPGQPGKRPILYFYCCSNLLCM